MNYQVKAFQLSFLLHSVVIALIIIGSTCMGHSRKVVVLDFDLRKPVPAVEKHVDLTPAPAIKMESINPAARASMEKEEPPRLARENPPVSPGPETPPIVKLPEAPSLENSPMGQNLPDQGLTVKEGSPGSAGGGPGTDSGPGKAEGLGDSPGARYINENFAYIRDKILKNIRYPDEARRKDWQGKILLSFVITTDGSVTAFKIIQSSGYKMLDRSAIETVRDAAPFPKPPGEAQLVIPISYRLE